MVGTHHTERDGARFSGFVRETPSLKPKDLVGIPWRVAFALQADGWWLRSDIIWSKPNPMPESITDRPTKAHEYVFLLTKAARYYYDGEAIKEPHEGGLRGGRQYAQAKGLILEKRPVNGQPSGNGHNRTGGTADGPQPPLRVDHRDGAVPAGAFRHLPGEAGGAVHPRGHQRAGRLSGVWDAVGPGSPDRRTRM